MQDRYQKLKKQGLTVTIGLVTLLSAIFLYLTIQEKRAYMQKELLYKKNELELSYMKYIEHLKLEYSNKLRILLNDEKVITAFANRDRTTLDTLVQPYFTQLIKEEPNFEIICFGLPDNTSFYRAHRPDLHGDNLSRVQGVKIVNEKKVEVGGFMLTKLGLYYRINSPVFYKEKYIGLVSYGINIAAVNHYVAKTFKSDVAILIDTKKFKNKKWYENITEGTIGDQTIITSTRDDDMMIENAEKLALKSEAEKIDIGDKSYFVHKSNSIYDLHNQKIATILLLQDITDIQKNFQQHLALYIAFALILIIVINIILIKIFNKMIEKIISMNTELHELNISLEEKVEERTKDLEKQTHIAQNAVKTKGEFLANMSHEIRTPLNAILGFVEILKEEEQDKNKLQYLTTIDRSSQSLLSIINDILDFSKIESGKITLDNTDFNSSEEFTTIAELFKAKCEEKKIKLLVEIDPSLPQYLNSDIQKIRQIVSNLLSNAIKFTSEEKQIKLLVKYTNEKLFISVKDEGIGIPKNRQKHIFEAFTQADTSTTRKYGGTGLGLSISNAFVKALGGTLQIQSEESKGSTFYFEIPCKPGKEIIKKETLSHDLDLKAFILVVEDNKANQMFIKVILKKMNLQFKLANNGLEAIEMFQKAHEKNIPYDLILMDENMPQMGGIEATQQILHYEKQHNFKHTPIIALTANALKGDKEKFMSAGMDEYLTKPIDKIKLYETIQRVLNNSTFAHKTKLFFGVNT